jgi:peptidoglycan L-alanyl-D-glutamate endopeptidase CwlK
VLAALLLRLALACAGPDAAGPDAVSEAAPATTDAAAATTGTAATTATAARAPTDAAPALPAPRVDRRLSVGRAPFGDIDLWLELGDRTVADVDALLADAHARYPDANARLAFLTDTFRGTPFEYESQLPTPAPGVLRVQLRSFDCTTFVIAMVAMTGARSFEELVVNLRHIRFLDGLARVDADPTNGNVLDFASDIFVEAAAGKGFLRDVTAEVAGTVPLTQFRARVTERRRTAEYDTEERLIRPRLHAGEVVSAAMLTRADFARIDARAVHDGDIFLFSRIDPTAPVGEDLLVGHLAVARVRDGVLTLTHATRDYLWRPDATWATPPSATGVFYADDPRREQLGVSDAGVWVDDAAGNTLRVDGRPYYGYDTAVPRPVTDYLAGAHIQGVMVLRPTNRAAAAVEADAAWLAGLPARPGGDAPVVVDSALTEQQAIRDGLSPECPPNVANAQRLVPVAYRGYDGAMHAGQVVVHRKVVPEVEALFAILRETGLPLRSVRPVSAFGWDDDRSMDADNTSAFNWRNVPGTSVLSRHACGLAIDVNPRTNPYVRQQNGAPLITPPGAVYDPAAIGTLLADHPAVQKLVALGWTWGGRFKNLKDWQHFEKGGCERP